VEPVHRYSWDKPNWLPYQGQEHLAVGMGYVQCDQPITDAWIGEGDYQLEVEGKMIAAKVHIRSPYDPENRRPRM